jgi:putative transposase
MSWHKTDIKDEKVKFIGDWLKGEFTFKTLCERYRISRKTGYVLVNRYRVEGEVAFNERSRARHHYPNQMPLCYAEKLIWAKHRYPTWGPMKIRNWLLINHPEENWPAISTIGELYKRHGLVKRRQYRRRVPAHSEPLRHCQAPNEVWSADFKGHFRLGNKKYCYPLTITDNYSRYLFECDGFESPNAENTIKTFKKIFSEYGLPEAIRTDNGQPFAGTGIGGLSRLSVWWLKLGIMPERIDLGCPEQNGRHERMHRTLKECTAKNPKATFKEQQACFDAFRNEYNFERPHDGINAKRPGDIHRRSEKNMPEKPPEVVYPDSFLIRKVRCNGDIKFAGKKYFLSELLCSEPVGLEMIDEDRAVLYFSKLKLGLIDARLNKITRP